MRSWGVSLSHLFNKYNKHRNEIRKGDKRVPSSLKELGFRDLTVVGNESEEMNGAQPLFLKQSL